MQVIVTNHALHTLILSSSDPLVGQVRIPPGETKTVQIKEIPPHLDSLIREGRISLEIVSEGKAARGSKTKSTPKQAPTTQPPQATNPSNEE